MVLSRFYIKLYKTLKSQGGYNLSPTGGLGSPGCFSEETKKKIGDKSRIHLIGKKYSEKTKQRMSDSHKGLLKGKKLSEKHKLNIKKSFK